MKQTEADMLIECGMRDEDLSDVVFYPVKKWTYLDAAEFLARYNQSKL